MCIRLFFGEATNTLSPLALKLAIEMGNFSKSTEWSNGLSSPSTYETYPNIGIDTPRLKIDHIVPYRTLNVFYSQLP